MNLATLVTVSGIICRRWACRCWGGRFFNPGDKANTQLVTIVNHKLRGTLLARLGSHWETAAPGDIGNEDALADGGG